MPNKSKDSRQAGMTPKIDMQFSGVLRSLPQGSSLKIQGFLHFVLSRDKAVAAGEGTQKRYLLIFV